MMTTNEMSYMIAQKEQHFLDSMLVFCAVHGLIDSAEGMVVRHIKPQGNDIAAQLEVLVQGKFLGGFIARLESGRIVYDYRVPSNFAMISPNQ